MRAWTVRAYLVQPRDAFQTRGVPVLGGPAPKQLRALLLDIRIGQVRSATDAQPLEQGLVGKGALEARAGVLDQTVEDDQGAQLAVYAAILELLPDGAGSLRGTGGLQLNHLDQLGDAAQVVFLIGLTRQPLDVDSDGGVGLLL